MRLNRYIASCTGFSRRTADRLTDEGRISVNGETAVKGMDIGPEDTVCVDGEVIAPPVEASTFLYYKPAGVVCTARDRHASRTITDEIKRLGLPETLTYAGRLDADSEGLLILTDDGSLINELMRGGTGHEKEYLVTVDRPVDENFLEKLRGEMYIPELGRKTLPCRADKTGEYSFRIILTQGLNRQIRRMCELCGYSVKKLTRIRIDGFVLGKMKPGEAIQI